MNLREQIENKLQELLSEKILPLEEIQTLANLLEIVNKGINIFPQTTNYKPTEYWYNNTVTCRDERAI